MTRRIIAAVGAAIALLAIGFWFCFGTLSPCGALRGEYRRQGQEKAGPLGKAVLGLAGDLNTDDMSPLECTQRAVRLRFFGRDAVGDLVQ